VRFHRTGIFNGQIKTKEDKAYFRQGLMEMLQEIEPEIVLVYGPMSKKVFNDLQNKTRFVFYEDWISRKKGGENRGNNKMW
jgi:quinol monooxygenase YgiN